MSLHARPSPTTGSRTRLSDRDDELHETIKSYDRLATHYADRYASVDLRTYYDTFLSLLPHGPGGLLDAGCGPGRDCQAFERRGMSVVGLDLSMGLLSIASRSTRAPLVRSDMRMLPFRSGAFRGVWSCASLVHMSPEQATRALRGFNRVLVPQGILFVSVTHGAGDEWRPDVKGGRRWFHYYEQAELEHLCSEAGFQVLSARTEPGVAAGIWINLFARRTGSLPSATTVEQPGVS